MLGPDDPLPGRPRRLAVAGVSGVGKTTLARRVAAELGVRHVEIDALFHGPGWVPRERFLDDVRAFLAQDAWTTEWQYADARPLVSARAEVLVWLDLPFWTVTLPQVVRRTVRRRVAREELWNGNVEGPLREFFTDREHIVRWAISTRKKYASSVPAAGREHPGLTIVHLRSHAEVERWLAGPLTRCA